MRNFDESYLKIAEIWAGNSRAIKAKVGAIIVKDNMIISDGFNGTPAGFDNDCEYVIGCSNPSMKNIIDWKPGIQCKQLRKTADGTLQLKNISCDINCEFAILKTKSYVLHAEANAITKLAKSGNSAEGSTLYITLAPCLNCAKLIIQSGIKRVVYRKQYKDTAGIYLLKQANIEVLHCPENE